MSKLRSVIRHEYLTIVKQPSFWITMLAFPIIIGFIVAIMYFGNKSSAERIEDIASDLKNVAVIDNSSLLNNAVVEAAGLSLSQSDEYNALREEVRTNKRPALVVFPEDLATSRTFRLYLASNDITHMGAASGLASGLLKTSLFLPLGSSEVITLAQNGADADMVIYKDGEISAGFNEYIAPGLFVLLFYIIFAFSVGYMLTSVSEEKENRSMEMVLTYVKPRTLILGKLLAVGFVTLTQIVFFGILAASVFIIAQNTGTEIALPFGIDLAKAVFNPLAIFFGAAFLIVGFLMFAGFMTATAAMAPSTKEANSFSTVFFLGAFVPFYFITIIATDPRNPVVTFLSYFPLTSPVVALIRNTLDSLNGEGWLILGVMSAFMVLSIWIAIRAFKLGALEFSQIVDISKLLKK